MLQADCTRASSVRARRRAGAAVLSAFAALCAGPAWAGGEERPVRGWLEHAYLEPSGLVLDAKLDTGARTSSIHAEILRRPSPIQADAGEGEGEGGSDGDQAEIASARRTLDEETGEPRLPTPEDVIEIDEGEEVEIEEADAAAFDNETIVFRITNEDGESSTLQRTVVRYAAIKNGDGTTERRPVVEMTACIAGVWVTGEVNLADRAEFNYPFLIGRNMLEMSGIVVDSREIYTRSARCSGSAP